MLDAGGMGSAELRCVGGVALTVRMRAWLRRRRGFRRAARRSAILVGCECDSQLAKVWASVRIPLF